LKNIHEIGEALASVSKIDIDAVQTDGDVLFHINLKDCKLTKEDYLNPCLSKRFFINFIGEILVRDNISRFATILTGLDPTLYLKMVGGCGHEDFGMYVDKNISIMTFQMHISLAQEILTEEFSNLSDDMDGQLHCDSVNDFFVGENPDDQNNPNLNNPNEE
jgi:hypothetical protein